MLTSKKSLRPLSNLFSYASLRRGVSRTPPPRPHSPLWTSASAASRRSTRRFAFAKATCIVRLSDILEHAPESVHRAIAHILLAKLYRKTIASAPCRPLSSPRVFRGRFKTSRARPPDARAETASSAPTGHHYDLDEVFESLNMRFFHGLLGRPTLTWSAHHARRMLGHYDAAHNTIVVSRVFDRPDTPRCAVEYLLYHEMLHLKHPVRVKAGRRCVHSREFQAEERLFPELEAAKQYLKRL